MEIEIYQAFTSAGVTEDKARMAADSIRKGIDDRYREHIETLATRKDLASAVFGLDRSIGSVRTDLTASINEARNDLTASINDVRTDLTASIKEVRTDLTASINEVRTDLDASINKVRSDHTLDVERLGARLDVAFAELGTKIAESANQNIRWTIGTMIAVAAVSFTAAKGLWG